MVERVLAGERLPVLALQPSPAGAGLNSNLRSKRARRASRTRERRRRRSLVRFRLPRCERLCRLSSGDPPRRYSADAVQPLPEPLPDIAEETAPLHLLYGGVGGRHRILGPLGQVLQAPVVEVDQEFVPEVDLLVSLTWMGRSPLLRAFL